VIARKRVLVMGLGRFGGGVAAARWFAEAGHDVLVTDLRPARTMQESVDEITDLGVRLRLGTHDPDDFDRAQVLVVNPAVPFDNPLVARARGHGAEVVTEIGLTLRHLTGPVVAITGTNGKSTTAALTAAMLKESGVPMALGGNIGVPLLNETPHFSPGTVAVLELSSFQLAWLEHDELRPSVAVVTNVTGDHYDRHGTFEHYVAAKRRLATAVPPEGVLVLNEDDPVARGFADGARAKIIWFGRDRPAPIDLDELGLVGRHNRANAAAAAHAALVVGATPEGCRQAAARFTPLPHRLQILTEKDGVLLVDDSVSTTPVATAAAVSSFERPVILLVGGREKGLDAAPILRAAKSAREVVVYGEIGPELHGSLPRSHWRKCFDEAVLCAFSLARTGDVVLLSPGFASYDEFPGFDARGERFRRLVETWL